MRDIDKLLLNFPLTDLSAIFLQRGVVKAAAPQISCLRKEVTARQLSHGFSKGALSSKSTAAGLGT